MSNLKGPDYLLLLLFADKRSPILGAVRLEKMIFLFKEEIIKNLRNLGKIIDSNDLPIFKPYNYGPFSKDIYEQVEFFRGIGFIKVFNLNSQTEYDEIDEWEEPGFIDELWKEDVGISIPDKKYFKYQLTDKGSEFVEKQIKNDFTDEQYKIIEDFKRKITQIRIKDLLHYVYVKYPDFTEKSKILDEVLRNE